MSLLPNHIMIHISCVYDSMYPMTGETISTLFVNKLLLSIVFLKPREGLVFWARQEKTLAQRSLLVDRVIVIDSWGQYRGSVTTFAGWTCEGVLLLMPDYRARQKRWPLRHTLQQVSGRATFKYSNVSLPIDVWHHAIFSDKHYFGAQVLFSVSAPIGLWGDRLWAMMMVVMMIYLTNIANHLMKEGN